MSSDIVILTKINFNNLMILIAFLEQKLAIIDANYAWPAISLDRSIGIVILTKIDFINLMILIAFLEQK